MTIICPHCKTICEGDVDLVGVEVRCPSCRNTFVVSKPEVNTPVLKEVASQRPGCVKTAGNLIFISFAIGVVFQVVAFLFISSKGASEEQIATAGIWVVAKATTYLVSLIVVWKMLKGSSWARSLLNVVGVLCIVGGFPELRHLLGPAQPIQVLGSVINLVTSVILICAIVFANKNEANEWFFQLKKRKHRKLKDGRTHGDVSSSEMASSNLDKMGVSQDDRDESHEVCPSHKSSDGVVREKPASDSIRPPLLGIFLMLLAVFVAIVWYGIRVGEDRKQHGQEEHVEIWRNTSNDTDSPLPAKQKNTTKKTLSAAECYQLGCRYQEGKGVAQSDAEAFKWFQQGAMQGHAGSQSWLGWMYLNSRGVAQNDVEAAKWHRKAAEQGNAYSQNQLGWMYQNGRGVAKNSVEAAKWYQKAAEQGNVDAQRALGEAYLKGEGVSQNDSTAANWMSKAAEKGDAEAQHLYGWMYWNGRGVPKNDYAAVGWFQKGAQQGNAKAQLLLGMSYSSGSGIEKNSFEAMKWIRKAAEQGESIAQCLLGSAYENGVGVSKNPFEAAKWMQRAAEQGHSPAQTELGSMYASGRGVPQNDYEAAKWFRKAAEQGDLESQAIWGSCLLTGRGVLKNEYEGTKWILKAAEQGHVHSQVLTGLNYARGSGGLPQDNYEAARWFRKAAEQGDADGQYWLGRGYMAGHGVPKSEKDAAMWIKKAAAQGHKEAEDYVQRMRSISAEKRRARYNSTGTYDFWELSH